MPRLRNSQTGAVVSTSDETAARLGSEWKPATKAPTTSKSGKSPSRSVDDEK